jgi:hypothetical protein
VSQDNEPITEHNIHYVWNPYADITVNELALCMPHLTIVPYGIGYHPIEKLPAYAQRHFVKVLPGVKAY